jgi:hypothetical protein
MVAFSNAAQLPKTHSFPNIGWRKFPPPLPLFCCKELTLEVCPSILDTICIYLTIIVCIIIIIIITAIELSLGGSSPYASTDKTNKNKDT